MSYEVYGFADFSVRPDPSTLLKTLRSLTPLGIFLASENCLIGFPPDLRPTIDSFIFIIGDSPDSMNSQYLLDYQDYDPQSTLDLPIGADERLSLLPALVAVFFDKLDALRLALCLTDCNEVDSIKVINRLDVTSTLKANCSVQSPPCIIYVIT